MSKLQKRAHSDLIKAWAEGLEIEIYSENCKKWLTILTPQPWWNDDFKYRIKKSKRVPFETFEECKPLLGKVVYSKDEEEMCIIVDIKFLIINNVKHVMFGLGNNSTFIYASKLLKHFKFEDGTPCGKLVK